MKYIYLIIFGFLMLASGCVDDYRDANPPRPLDAPYFVISSSAPQNPNGSYAMNAGEEVLFTISIIDAPGGIDSIGVSVSEGSGTIILDESAVAGLIGQTSGSFTATYVSNSTIVGSEDIRFIVRDSQEPIQFSGRNIENQKSTTKSVTVTTIYSFPALTFSLTPGAAATTAINGGESVTYNIKVLEFPGGIGGVNATILSGEGDLVVNQTDLDEVMNGTSQDSLIAVTFTAPNNVGVTRFGVSVYDATDAQRTTGPFFRNVFIDACVITLEAQEAIVGVYTAEATGTVGAADSTYTITETITITHEEEGLGVFSISDVSFGLYSQIYDRATMPTGEIDVCNGSITDREVEDIFGSVFTVSGTVSDDGTISLEWENDAGDTGTVLLTKQ